ncbi:hypothetical protein AESSP_01609 [Aestuariimicrobium sp. T2.26MG-19.2B]|nr:hypothetical protein AESSP_01609 [Aestuariimicrobium sp. T2.26MG-19.2B]
MGLHDELLGAWYINPALDVIELLASVVTDEADACGVPLDRVTLYGSSLGGFGALMLASAIPGALAIAEVPQVDFELWPFRSARAALEEHVTHMELAEYRKSHPEQLSVRSRFERSGIPRYRIVTNTEDLQFEQTLDLHRWVSQQRREPLGGCELLVSDAVAGHAPLGQSQARRHIEQCDAAFS